jgi:Tfp pilus assembly protein PilF
MEYLVEYDPPLNEAHVYKFSDIEEAIKSAKEVAAAYRVKATIYKSVKKFAVVVEEVAVDGGDQC